MTGSNEWGSNASVWLETKKAADDFKKADKGLKNMTPENVRIAKGHGVEAVRSDRGRQVFESE